MYSIQNYRQYFLVKSQRENDSKTILLQLQHRDLAFYFIKNFNLSLTEKTDNTSLLI